MEKEKKNQRKSRIVAKKVVSNLLKNWSMGKLQKLQMNNKSTENYSHDGHSENESLLNYLAYLKEAIATTTEQIRKENIKAKQTFFNISAHFGINEWTRDKIQENMDSVGVISLAEPSSMMKRRRSQKKNERGKNRKVRGDEETGKLGQPKKRVKMMGNAGVEEVVKPK